MIKLTTLNNQLYFYLIDEKSLFELYINYNKMYNLIINEGNAITIKKAIPEKNEKQYKPRNEVISRIYKDGKKFLIKIGIGKEFKSIESVEDIAESHTIELENYVDIKNFVIQDFEKYKTIEELKQKAKQNKRSNKDKKDIKGF